MKAFELYPVYKETVNTESSIYTAENELPS